MLQQRRFLVQDVVKEESASARPGHFQSGSIQIAAIHCNAKIVLQHFPGDPVSTSDFQDAAQLTSGTTQRLKEHTMSPLHPKMICRRELKPLVRHGNCFRLRKDFNRAHRIPASFRC